MLVHWQGGKTDVTFTKPIFFFDIYNTFRFIGFVVQKCWLKNDALCLRASISDVFQRSVQDMAHDCGFFYTVQKTRSRSHRLDISIRYTFNAQKSKYKGTGAGKAEQQRMGSN